VTEIRRHYHLDEYCIIAPKRGIRPSDFREEKEIESSECVFCPGNEERTPPATAVYTNEGVRSDEEGLVRGWQVRCVPNLYPALSPEDKGGFGFHEVIIETPTHGKEPSIFSDEEMLRLLQVYRDRYRYYMAQGGVKFVSLFKNHGRTAGASIAHSHTQLIALPLVPPQVSRETDDECWLCEALRFETASQRLVMSGDGWVAFAPYFSKHPFEVWIVPIQHLSNLREIVNVEGLSLMLRGVLAGMRALFGRVDYNYIFYQHADERYHFHVKLFPRLSIAAGFEEHTGIYINTVAPEAAASILRERMNKS
jgi:UDPglucose--hexose-1-phosphate uridylyltransferase